MELNNLIHKKFKKWYVIAYSFIAVSLIINQVLIQYYFSNQEEYSLINISGKQRMLSQKIAKGIIIRKFDSDMYDLHTISSDIKSFEDGNNYIKQEINNGSYSDEINLLFQSIQTKYKTLTDLYKKSINEKQEIDLEKIKKLENDFLITMDQFVYSLDENASSKIKQLRILDFILFLLAIVILFLELKYIFIPLDRYITKVVHFLNRKNRETVKLLKETQVLTRENEKVISNLKSFDVAIDNTLLYCRLNKLGEIIHMGKQFMELYESKVNQKISNFSEFLTSNVKQQLEINSIIQNITSSGWQGELKIEYDKDTYIWLETRISLINYDGAEQLLVTCLDISKRKQKEDYLQKVNQELYADKINQQKIISSQIVESQENEQNRIAKELHDGVGQMLTGLKFTLESVEENDVEETKEKIKLLKSITLDIIKNIRNVTFNLTPPELEDYGLISAIEKLVIELRKYTDKNIQLVNQTETIFSFDNSVKINVYRIIQEALNNSIKYADSEFILIKFFESDEILSISVVDDGKGFNFEEINDLDKPKMGMLFMKERASFINSRIFIQSKPNRGTKITLNIPIKKEH
ncbi:MAG: histidine kinase [Flavobacteriales bacterium]|nr:histidine kinase [Flavobacteriales bacterium]